jgi:hypothetical protein
MVHILISVIILNFDDNCGVSLPNQIYSNQMANFFFSEKRTGTLASAVMPDI